MNEKIWSKECEEKFQKRIKEMSDVIAKKINKRVSFNLITNAAVNNVLLHFVSMLEGKDDVWKDRYFPYWDRRDTNAPSKCSMLDMCFHIEKKAGVVLYIDLKNKL